MIAKSWVFTLALLFAAACKQAPPAREYQLKGQILGVKPEALEVLVAHEDIKGFMPAMTMPYKVKDASILKGKEKGDLITATLVVAENYPVLSSITRTGHAEVVEPPPADVVQPIEVITEGKQVPEELFVDQNGTARPFSALNKGHRVALTFMYTRCPMPDFCPLMDRNFATLQESIRKTPDLGDVRLISVTIDPGNDKPPVLKEHAGKLKADPTIWSFLTGDQENVSRFAAQFGLAIVRNEKDPIDISHTLRTVVIGPDGRLVKSHSGNSWTPAELLADLKAAPAPAN